MAVSLNANFMRSDYMLSDAALPLRLEELEQAELMEQGAKFAEILGGIGEQPTTATVEVADEQISMPAEQPMQFESVDELAQAVANGEIQLTDVPEELITKELLEKITKLMTAPEKDDQFVPEKDAVEQQVVTAEFIAAYAVQQENVPADKSAELTELAAAVNTKVEAINTKAEVVEASTVQQPDAIVAEAPAVEFIASEVSVTDAEVNETLAEHEDIKTAQQPNNYTETEVFATESSEAPAVKIITTDAEINPTAKADAKPNITETEVTPNAAEIPVKSRVIEADVKQPSAEVITDAADEIVSVQPETKAEVQPVKVAESYVPIENADPTQQTGQQNTGAQQQSADNSAQQGMAQQINVRSSAKTDVIAESVHNDMAQAMNRVETRTVAQQNKTAEIETQQVQQYAVTAKPERLISKTSELSMIKEATRPTQHSNEVQQPVNVMVQPMTTALNTPVTFPTADGSEIEVSPGEILQQVVDKVIETIEHPTAEGTEYKVTLTPEDLGTITVKMTKAVDGSVTVSITADNARTQRILEEHSALMQTNLRQNGIELENWQTVTEYNKEAYAEDYNGSSRNPYHRNDEGNTDDNAEDTTFAEIIASM